MCVRGNVGIKAVVRELEKKKGSNCVEGRASRVYIKVEVKI